MKLYVGKWDCESCGHEGNLGPHVHCANCGAPRPEDVEFYLPRGAEVVTDEEAIKAAKEGANWVCAFCSNSNRQSYNACVSCGALKVDSEIQLKERTYNLDEVPTGEKKNFQPQAPPPPKFMRKGPLRYIWYALFSIAGYLGLNQITTTIEVPIQKIHWERTILYQEYKQVEEEDWSIPAGGEMIKSFQALHHTDRKIVGYETKTRTVQEAVGKEKYVCGKKDLGNGYFKDVYCSRTIYQDRQETYEAPIYKDIPVYKTKYRYKIYRWKPFEKYTTSGQTKEVAWKKIPTNIANNTQKYREHSRKETYYFMIEDHKKRKRWYQTDYDFWDRDIYIGKRLKAEKSMIFGTFHGLVDMKSTRKSKPPTVK